MNEKNNNKSLKILNILIVILVIEKIIQHFLVALFFLVEIPGIGTPDIGPWFNINNNLMSILNIINSLFFVLCLIYKFKQSKNIIFAIIFLAVLDIFKEFLFHGFFYITISVLVSLILIFVSLWYYKLNKRLN